MSDTKNYSSNGHSTALLVRSHGFSLIWVIPFVAAAVTLWMAWHSYINRGTTITITFETATGIEPGKTKIKYKDAEFGLVESIEPSADLSKFTVTAKMNKASEPFLTKATRFWVVKPNPRDLSLGSLISGAYIEFFPEKGDSSRHFDGEQSPVFIPSEGKGTIYTLHADQVGSIQQGSLVYYRGINVGRVLGYQLADNDGTTDVRVFISSPHDKLIHANTRFWNTSGISVIIGSAGLKIQLESLQSLVSGGVAFDTFNKSDENNSVTPNSFFNLYSDEASAEDSIYKQRIRFLLHFNSSVGGIAVGSAVRLQGIVIGQVKEVHLEYNNKNFHLSVTVVIEVESDRLKTQLGNNTTISSDNEAYAMFRKLVSSGLRAHINSASLLTGQKVIDLDIVPNAPSVNMIEGNIYPEIPTSESSDLDGIISSAKELLTSLQTTANTLNTAISDKQEGGDLAGTLHEIKDAARSLRVLTDYLEDHPEAILRGKPKDTQ